MKILSNSIVLASLLAAMAAAVPKPPPPPRDAGFMPDDHGDHNHTAPIKSTAKLGGNGAQIQLCPTGDCAKGQAITLLMTRLEEFVEGSDQPFVQAAKNFNALNASWSDFVPITVNGTAASTSSFATTFFVGNQTTTETSFNLTTLIYQANGTTMNGNQSIDVPAGALKFSVTITNWPFLDKANKLRFGVILKAQGKKGDQRNGGTKKPKNGKPHMDRLDMGEGLFMDAPTLAVVDDVTTPINATSQPQGKQADLVWVFPYFTKSLYYDPILGADNSTNDTSVATNTSTTTNTSMTSAPTPTTTKAASSASQIAGVLVSGVLTVVGACFV